MADMPLPLRAYLGATYLAPLIAQRNLRKRRAAGKEHPTRWTEKLGQPGAPRPDGKLIWLNAVGLGEVLSLRGLIAALSRHTDAHFLVTSTTRTGAEILAQNMPPRTIHQFLPLDAPRYRRAFLNHWRPDLCLWAEQEIWPGFVTDLTRRNIPQAMVAARMTGARFRKNARFRGALGHLYRQMAMITAQDQDTADYLQSLGAPSVDVTGSLKPSAPSLHHVPDPALEAALKDRFVWITAPSHAADEALAVAAHKRLLADKSDALLIIAPRFPDRAVAVDLPMATRSKNETPTADHQVYLADTYGALGLLYRLSEAALIGGTHDATEGHSPWEAATLDTAILHGPNVGNFNPDYAALAQADAAISVRDPQALATALTQDLSAIKANAKGVIAAYAGKTDALAQSIVALL